MNFMYFMQNMDFTENIPRPKTRRKIKFDNVVNVVLIPSVKEMESIKNDLWWSKMDYISFYTSSCKELRDFMEEHSPPLNRVQAMKILYQPSLMSKTILDEEPMAISCLAQI